MMLTLTRMIVAPMGRTLASTTVYMNIKHSTRLEWIA